MRRHRRSVTGTAPASFSVTLWAQERRRSTLAKHMSPSHDYTILGSERCASGSWAAAADPAFAGRVLPLLLARVRDEDQRERQESVPPVRLRVPVAFLLRVRELVA